MTSPLTSRYKCQRQDALRGDCGAPCSRPAGWNAGVPATAPLSAASCVISVNRASAELAPPQTQALRARSSDGRGGTAPETTGGAISMTTTASRTVTVCRAGEVGDSPGADVAAFHKLARQTGDVAGRGCCSRVAALITPVPGGGPMRRAAIASVCSGCFCPRCWGAMPTVTRDGGPVGHRRHGVKGAASINSWTCTPASAD